MVLVYENVPVYGATKPMGCIRCNYKRAFDVPMNTCVRKARHSVPTEDIILLKCKKCSHQIGVSIM